jgi:predicted short-subunit dehydrogenase-like oxidoreductase (DUF2520 family)
VIRQVISPLLLVTYLRFFVGNRSIDIGNLAKRSPGGRLSFSLVGPGKAGTSISLAMSNAGFRCTAVVTDRASQKEIAQLKMVFKGSELFYSLDDLFAKISHDALGDVLIIAVQDAKLGEVAEQLSRFRTIDWAKRVVLHLSGATSVNVLNCLRRKGASVGALHPMASFASRFNAAAAQNIYYDFFGDAKSKVIAYKIIRRLKSRLLILSSERERILLHIASTFISNATVVAVRSAERLVAPFVSVNDMKSIMEGLLKTTIENLLSKHGMESLTGPLERGDVEVVIKHIVALKSSGDLLEFYRAWSMLGVNELLKLERDPLKKARLKEIKRILSAQEI